MKKLFEMLKSGLLSEFGNDVHPTFKLQNVKLDNNQLVNMENINQFNFPTIFFRYEQILWEHIGHKVRHGVVTFELNLIIESYKEMEDSFEIDEYMDLIKCSVTKMSYNDSDYNISAPMITGEDRGFNETNLMSMRLLLETNITDFSCTKKTQGTINDIVIETSVTVPTESWCWGTGTWRDDLEWDDTLTIVD